MKTIIPLGATFSYVTTPQVSKSISQVTVIRWIDNRVNESVVAQTKEIGFVTLWATASYVAIGDWTEAQAEARLKQVIITLL